ncbi:MAG: transposase [Elusimicrobia bacterium]|nr:transposase [Elusimicrobiota bacterium]
MGKTIRLDFPGALHLIANYGNEQKPIFKDEEDYNAFLSILHFSSGRYGFKFHAYALLSDHYYLLIETPMGELSLGMRHINGAYAEYFNDRRQRSGHLFRGRFKSLLAEKEGNLPALTRFIHQGPVKNMLTIYPWSYPWSSCRDYLGLRSKSPWITLDETLTHFGPENNIQQINYRLFLEAQTEENPWDAASGGAILGSDGYLEKIRQTIKPFLKKRNLPWPKSLNARPKADEIINAACEVFNINREHLFNSRWKHSNAKAAALYLLRERCGLSLQEIAAQFNLSQAGVCKAVIRFSARLANDPAVTQKLEKIHQILKHKNSTPEQESLNSAATPPLMAFKI